MKNIININDHYLISLITNTGINIEGKQWKKKKTASVNHTNANNVSGIWRF